jgi:hypothetical protein
MRFAAALVLLLGAGCSAVPAPPPAGPPADPKVLLFHILDLHRAACREDRNPKYCCSDLRTTSMVEAGFHRTEARLWTLVFPKEAAEFAFAAAQEDAADPDDRALAVYMVQVLALSGDPRAEALLLGITRTGDRRDAAAARIGLNALDPQGEYAEIHRRAALQGEPDAVETLGTWVDNDNTAALQAIAASGDSELRWNATRSLLRMGWLKSRDLDSRLKACLSSDLGEGYLHFDWALRIARNRSLPGLKNILRRRLDAGEAAHRSWCASFYDRGEGCVPGQGYEREFTERYRIADDDHFDEVLRAYAELGGPLSDLERRRLDFLGYGDNPSRRLFEFVIAWLQE